MEGISGGGCPFRILRGQPSGETLIGDQYLPRYSGSNLGFEGTSTERAENRIRCRWMVVTAFGSR